MGMTELDRKLQAQLLGRRRVEGDRLMLDDAVLLGALDGSRPLTAGERAALQASPPAAMLLQGGQRLRVRDGAGNTVLEGALDSDGELEGPWPFPDAPASHFQHHGARFAVEPVAPSGT